ncbi:MAG: DUF1206 domain-containing protein, partial [Acidobacteria bacterium]|nr:DUF1206 domain-containing protein [Acidobacteriota bacterium]
MSQTGSAIEEVKDAADEVAEKVGKHPWTEQLARIGYAAKGIVYIVVGALAVLTALGFGGKAKGTQGAMSSIARQPFGKVLLSIVAIGLVAYVIWHFVQAVTDADDKGTKAKGIALRLGYAGSGFIYAGLALSAARIVFGANDDGKPSAAKSWTASVLKFPFGHWLVVLAGLGVIGYGFYQCYKGYKAKFRKRLKEGEMSERGIRWATRSGRVGFIARGIVFLIVGGFLIQAALSYDSS